MAYEDFEEPVNGGCARCGSRAGRGAAHDRQGSGSSSLRRVRRPGPQLRRVPDLVRRGRGLRRTLSKSSAQGRPGHHAADRRHPEASEREDPHRASRSPSRTGRCAPRRDAGGRRQRCVSPLRLGRALTARTEHDRRHGPRLAACRARTTGVVPGAPPRGPALTTVVAAARRRGHPAPLLEDHPLAPRKGPTRRGCAAVAVNGYGRPERPQHGPPRASGRRVRPVERMGGREQRRVGDEPRPAPAFGDFRAGRRGAQETSRLAVASMNSPHCPSAPVREAGRVVAGSARAARRRGGRPGTARPVRPVGGQNVPPPAAREAPGAGRSPSRGTAARRRQ